MRLFYQNCIIRSALPEDAALLAHWWNDGNVMAHAGFPRGLGTTSEQVAESLMHDSDDLGQRLILEAEGQPIGEMSYRNLGDGIAEIGIKICEADFQNHGLGKIYLSLLIKWLFDRGQYHKIILDTNLKNLRAQRVYESLGFRKIGLRENSWRDQLGTLQSAVDYELLPENFCSALYGLA